MRKYLLAFCFISYLINTYGQINPRASKWMFGKQSELDFMTGSPVPFNGNPNNQEEGSASIADYCGNLLFYMNGIRIRDASNATMPNGDLIFGGRSSSMAALISPVLGNPNQYYAFSVDGITCDNDSANGPQGKWDGLTYSIVDMTLPGNGTFTNPLGDVIAGLKNLSLVDSTAEKVTAAPHANGRDYWIITMKNFTKDVYAFLVSCNGINPTPVISTLTIGLPDTIPGNGYLRSSHDGKTLVNSCWNYAFMFGFDNQTGVANNSVVTLRTNLTTGAHYGVAFSPNDSLIYVATTSDVFRYERFTPTPMLTEIKYSAGPQSSGGMRGMQLGPDGKIYYTCRGDSFLSIINDPNNVLNPNFSYLATPKLNGKSRMGIPNYYIPKNLKIIEYCSADPICPGDTLQVGKDDSNFSYTWTPNFKISDTGLSNPMVFPDTTTTYIVTTDDSTICLQTDSIIITVDPAPQLIIADTTICSSTSVDLDAGNPGTIYIWSTGETAQIITTDTVGTYWVKASNGVGCSDSAAFIVDTIPCFNLSADLNHANNVCYNDSLGNAVVSPTNGTAPYTYQWLPYGGTDSTAAGLVADIYNVTIWDSNNDSVVLSVVVTEPTDISVTQNHTDAKCDSTDGTAWLIASGGTPVYAYSWTPGGFTTDSIASLAAGIYSVTVTDINGCQKVEGINISNIPSPTLTMNLDIGILCAGFTNSEATATAGGGNPGYSYLWDVTAGSQTTGTATGLGAGTYNVTVTDDLGCVAIEQITITEPTVLIPSEIHDDVLCYSDSTGSVNLTVFGGTPGYGYSWDNGATSQDINGVPADTYTVIITDANGCSSIESVTITEVSSVTTTFIGTGVLCSGDATGSIDITPSGGTPAYTFLWNNGSTDEDIPSALAGSYTIMITDLNGCTFQETIIISEPVAMSLSALGDTICPGDTAQLNAPVSNGSGIIFWQWDPPVGLSNSTIQDPIANVSQTTTYTITVMDDCDTIIETVTVLVNSSPITDAWADQTTLYPGGITGLHATGGVTYSWSPTTGMNNSADQNPLLDLATVTGQGSLTFVVLITDMNGCMAYDTVTINIDSDKDVFIPNIFSPNGDMVNDVFKAEGRGIVDLELKIYDRWGNLLYETNDISKGWNGVHKNQQENLAVFTYVVMATFYDGSDETITGTFSLVR